MINLPDLKNTDVKDKKVLLRLDLDVPLSNDGEVEDDTRLKDSLETLNYLLEKGATVIIGGHLGRPTKQFSIFNFKFSETEKEFSLKPISRWFGKHFNDMNHYS